MEVKIWPRGSEEKGGYANDAYEKEHSGRPGRMEVN